MSLTPRLELRQSQSLVMTPQLQQAIKLLQLSYMELAIFVEQELEQNPLLERDEGAADPDRNDSALDDASPQATTEADQGDGGPAESDVGSDVADSADLDAEYDDAWGNDMPSDAAAGDLAPGLRDAAFAPSGSGGGFDNSLSSLEETLPETRSLRDHLTEQLGLDIEDPVDRMIGLHLIDMLDGSGYIAGDLDQVAATLGCDMERVEATLLQLQGFDPVGVFARDLAECLALQLLDRDRLDPAMQALVDNLDLLAKRDFARLRRLTGVDDEDMAEMIAEIRALDPKPAQAFDHAPAQTVIPDIFMRRNPIGGWLVELNTDTLPRVLVNNTYFAEIRNATRSKKDKQYINDCYQSANWLVKSLHQRAITILKVATELVRQQEMFFIKGVQHLRPLVLRDISEVIEMHESTVSRVTSNKYIATPRGIYELKYFFSAAIGSSSGGSAHSAESVRHRVKALIDGEAPETVLSDDSIVETLHAEGVDIARRTVAKYRQNMGIPSSVQRRREKMSEM